MKRILSILAALAASLSLPNASQGQERIELGSIPDLSVYEAALPLGVRWRRNRSSTKRDVGAAWSLGAGVGRGAGVSGGIGAGALALGFRSRAAIAGIRGELTGLLPAEGEGIDTQDLRGRYRATALAHLAPKSDRGISLALDGWLRHTGRTAFRLDAPRFGTAPMVTGGGEVTAFLRATDDDDVALGVPVKVRAERSRWTDEGTVREADSQAITMGLATQPGSRDAVRGTLDILKATVEHTRFEPRVTSGASMLPDVDGAGGVATRFRKVTIGAGASELTFFERKIMGTFQMRAGWSWLEADVGERTVKDNAFDFTAGANLKFGKPNDASRIGFAVSRDPNRSADGRRILSDTRIELSSDHESEHTEIAVRGALSWLNNLKSADEGSTPSILRYGTHLEGFYKLPLNFQAGAYVATSFEPHGAHDPWAVKRTLNTEAGLLLRWRRPALAPAKKIERRHHHYSPAPRRPHRGHRRPIEIH